MIVSSLKATNFMRFRKFEIESLPTSGLIGIFGDNECGKSTVGELICYALFGRTPKSPDGKPDNLIRWNEDAADVEMGFSLGDRRFRVTRTLRRDGSGAASLVEEPAGTVLVEGPASVDAALPDLLGFGFREFRYSTYIAQKELDIILHSAEDRRVVLNNMLGVGFMERMAKKVASKRVAREVDLKTLHRRIGDKNDVLHVYLSREDDLKRVEEREELVNRQLLTAIRDRDHNQSTLALLSEIRNKKEKFDILDLRIKSRREQLKKVEAEAAALIREGDSVPRMIEENKKKEALIEEIRHVHIPQLEHDLQAVAFHRELQKRLEEKVDSLRTREAAYQENSERMEVVRKAESEIEQARTELVSIANFLESFGSEQQFTMLLPHLSKDIDLVRSEVEKAQLANRKDYYLFEEKEKLLTGQLDRLGRQMETEEMKPVDLSELAHTQALELQNARRRDLSLVAGGASLLVGIVLPLALSMPLLLIIMLGALPSAGAAAVFQGRVRNFRQRAHHTQQQSYAFSIAQRGMNELQETEDEIRSQLKKLAGEKERLRKEHEHLSSLAYENFGAIEKSAERMSQFPLPALSRAHAQMLQMLRDYELLRRILGNETSIEQILSFDYNSLTLDKRNRKEEMEARIEKLKPALEIKTELQRARESIVREMEKIQAQVESLRKDIDGARIKESDEPRLHTAIREANLQIEQLRREIEQNSRDTLRIQSDAERAQDLEARRRALIQEIDEDMIRYYELREATRDIDVSDARFVHLTQRLSELEREVSELTSVIAKLDAEKNIVRKDLDRVPNVQSEMDQLRAEQQAAEADVLKYRELETLFISTGQGIKKRLIPQIEAYFAWILPKMTRGRYQRVRLGDDFDINVFSYEKNDFVPLSVLSGGTMDQMLISLRLAFARAATASTHVSHYLFLDEPFSSFDESRRQLFFALLDTMKATFQQMFLISHLPNLEEFTDHYMRVSLHEESQPSLTSWT